MLHLLLLSLLLSIVESGPLSVGSFALLVLLLLRLTLHQLLLLDLLLALLLLQVVALQDVLAAGKLSQDVLECLVFTTHIVALLLEVVDVLGCFSKDGSFVQLGSNCNAVEEFLAVFAFVVIIIAVSSLAASARRAVIFDFGIQQGGHGILQFCNTVVDVVAVTTLNGIVSSLLVLTSSGRLCVVESSVYSIVDDAIGL